MTREFNTHRRNNSPLPPRNRPTDRYSDTRPPRPGRPRLSRAAVDRGWESGAQFNHADYHPRNESGRASHNDRRNYQSPARTSSSPNASGNYRSEGNQGRSYNNRRDGYQGNHSYDNRRDGYQGNHPRDRFADDGRRSPDEGRFRERNQPQNDRGRNAERDNRPPREFDRRAPRTYERGGNKPFAQGRPPIRNAQRPAPPRRPQRFVERFEGDYERFSDDDDDLPLPPSRSFGKPFQGERGSRAPQPHERPPEEQHVTRLPTGRVLKGPRSVQRRDAEFWTEVEEDTEELLEHVHTPVPPRQSGKPTARKAGRSSHAPHPPKRAKSAPRERAPRALHDYRKAGPSGRGPRAASSRPQRGFKRSAR